MRIRIMSIIMVLLFAAGAVFAEGTFSNHPWGTSADDVIRAEGYNMQSDDTYENGDRRIRYLNSVLLKRAMVVFFFSEDRLDEGWIVWSADLYGMPHPLQVTDILDDRYDRVDYEDVIKVVDTSLILDPTEDENAIDYAFWHEGFDTLIVYARVPNGIMLLYYDGDRILLDD